MFLSKYESEKDMCAENVCNDETQKKDDYPHPQLNSAAVKNNLPSPVSKPSASSGGKDNASMPATFGSFGLFGGDNDSRQLIACCAEVNNLLSRYGFNSLDTKMAFLAGYFLGSQQYSSNFNPTSGDIYETKDKQKVRKINRS